MSSLWSVCGVKFRRIAFRSVVWWRKRCRTVLKHRTLTDLVWFGSSTSGHLKRQRRTSRFDFHISCLVRYLQAFKLMKPVTKKVWLCLGIPNRYHWLTYNFKQKRMGGLILFYFIDLTFPNEYWCFLSPSLVVRLRNLLDSLENGNLKVQSWGWGGVWLQLWLIGGGVARLRGKKMEMKLQGVTAAVIHRASCDTEVRTLHGIEGCTLQIGQTYGAFKVWIWSVLHLLVYWDGPLRTVMM